MKLTPDVSAQRSSYGHIETVMEGIFALPEEDRLFSTTINRETVWVIEDGAAFTLMYPSDY